jgi:protein gp37
MAQKSQIQWTDATWNIARGCTKVSPGCKFCYMMRDGDGLHGYDGTQVTRTKTVFDFPLKYKQTKSEAWGGRPLIFTSSLTDFFHEEIDGFRDEAWDIIRRSPHLIFQILTKRTDRIADHLPADWGQGWDNVWLGASVENDDYLHRIGELTAVPAQIHFLSVEPMLGPVDIFAADGSNAINWVIVGGESGNDTGKWGYRPCAVEWIEQLVHQCYITSTPVFVKQLGTYLAKELKLSNRHGSNIDEWPLSIQVREFPPILFNY